MKKVLVIDVPEDVTDVICAYDDRKGITHQIFYKLRPLPQREEEYEETLKCRNDEFGFMYRRGLHVGYDIGYNACLDEILGEKECTIQKKDI